MDKRDALKSMLNNIINDKPEEASLDFHTYITAKMKQVSGLEQQAPEPTRTDDIVDDDFHDDDDAAA